MSEQVTARNVEEEKENNNFGIRITYNGRTAPWHIVRKVKPRAQNIIEELSIGSEDDQASNMVIEGENLQAMVSLYKYRGQVDLIVTDPPYNTGNDFRYNDKWDEDPNDPDLGDIVPEDDGSRHTKWLRFMTPRIWMMKEMLKPNGVLAICIDHRELFRLGMLLDEIFGEHNRIGILNWQKSYSPRNDNKHVSTATEYVLIYTKDIEMVKTGLLPRDDSMNSRYVNPDNDPEGPWKKGGDPTVRTPSPRDRYAIQSPFTGALYYPGSRAWAHAKRKMKAWLEEWGVKYVERDIDDGFAKALVIKDAPIPEEGQDISDHPFIKACAEKAKARLERGNWPRLYFTNNGYGGPALKRYLKDVKKGRVPMTYWADEDYETPFYLGSQSWDHEESGHSQAGTNELNAIIGRGHNFETVKPLKLIQKIIQLWCPPNGIVMDPFAGSGTTGHAVLA
jgi:adenine-specific DNA-methyltransferase